MAKVITYSRKFPSYHPKAGQPTYFVEKYLNSNNIDYLNNFYVHLAKELNPNIPFQELSESFINQLASGITDCKNTTVRAGKRFKKGDFFSPRVWGTDINPKSGRSGPYHSKQIILAPDTEILEVWDIEIDEFESIYINQSIRRTNPIKLANNDGLGMEDFFNWFSPTLPFTGQIICWKENIKY